MSTAAGPPIAIITDAGHPTALGAGRALYRAGATVLGLTAPSTDPPVHSRVWRELHVVQGGDDAWLEAVRGLAIRAGRPVYLLPSSDQLVEVFSRRRNELGDKVRLTLPQHPIVDLMLDKTRFYAWAAARGLPVPESVVTHSADALNGALANIQYPVVVKPLVRTAEWNKVSPGQKAFKLYRAGDLERIRFPLFAVAPAYLVSRWIEGPDDAVHYCLAFCAQPGRIESAATGRKLLQFPRETGSTAICVGTSNDELLELTADLFRQTSFVGLGSLEVKYDEDGRPWITEPTVGRPNLQSYSAFAQGVDLYALALNHALGRPSRSPARRKRNVVWFQEAFIIQIAKRTNDQPLPWRLVVGTLLKVRRVSGAYSSWWDPAPLVHLVKSTLAHVWRRIRGA